MISQKTFLIEKVKDFNFNVNPAYSFSCVHNACDLMMQLYGIENRGFYLDCTLDLKIVPIPKEDNRQKYKTLYRHEPLIYDDSYQFLHLSDYSEKEIWEMNQASVLNNVPVIIGVDQYYLPYNKAYHKIHGAHAVILSGFREGKDCFIIDCIGQSDYRGFVNIEQVQQARISQNSWSGTINSGGSIQYASITINGDKFNENPKFLLEKTLLLSYDRFYGLINNNDGSLHGIEAMQYMFDCLYEKLKSEKNAYKQAFMDFYTDILYHIRKKELFINYLRNYMQISSSDSLNTIFYKIHLIYKKWYILMKLCLKIAHKSTLVYKYLQEFRDLHVQCIKLEKEFHNDFRKYIKELRR